MLEKVPVDLNIVAASVLIQMHTGIFQSPAEMLGVHKS